MFSLNSNIKDIEDLYIVRGYRTNVISKALVNRDNMLCSDLIFDTDDTPKTLFTKRNVYDNNDILFYLNDVVVGQLDVGKITYGTDAYTDEIVYHHLYLLWKHGGLTNPEILKQAKVSLDDIDVTLEHLYSLVKAKGTVVLITLLLKLRFLTKRL